MKGVIKMEDNYLNEIAQTVKADHENGITLNEEVTPDLIPGAIPIINEEIPEGIVTEEVSVPEAIHDDDDDDCVIIVPPSTSNATSSLKGLEDDGTVVTEMEDARLLMSDMPDDVFKDAYKNMNSEVFKYKKELMINQGFTSDEANNAAKNRFQRNAVTANTEYVEKNPKLGIVEVSKINEDQLEFTSEEHDKLQKVKSIKLVIVENQELEVLNIKKDFKEEYLGKYMREIDGSLCHYTTPLPIFGDMVTFNGAQTMQLVSVVSHDDDEISEVLERKATLIYDRLGYGNILTKYDGKGNISMSYNEFINTFMYQDIDIALYAIIVASSMEYSETELKCSEPSCKAPFKQKYNMKKLLQPDMLEYFKNRFEEILSNRNSTEIMEKLHNETSRVIRVKSNFTNNVYDMEFPTIGKAISHYKAVDTTNPQAVYNSTIGLYINVLYIYDAKDNTHIPVKGKDILSVFGSIPQVDIELLSNYIENHMSFIPKFKLTSKCTKCGKEMVNELSIDQMVFLRAQDSSIQIQ